MPTAKPHPTIEVLAWLQQLLAERYGHIFDLELVGDDIVLTLAGEFGSVRQPVNPAFYMSGRPEFGVGNWDFASELLRPVFPGLVPAPASPEPAQQLTVRTPQGIRVS